MKELLLPIHGIFTGVLVVLQPNWGMSLFVFAVALSALIIGYIRAENS